MQEFDAVLVTGDEVTRGRKLNGRIYNDKDGRFPNGCYVTTSPVKSFSGYIAVTESGTRYFICDE